MATATAAPTHSGPTTNNGSRHTHMAPRPPDPPHSLSNPSVYAVEVERDEVWVRQLQEEQQQRFSQQASVMHKELLDELERAGPFATTETREALQAHYDERLEQMRTMQQEELDQHIEMERQERLWSLGIEDENWDGWNRVLQEQAAILANIKRGAAVGADGGIQERIRENAREAEDVGRRSEEWQRTEHQRVRDRARWAERTRLTNMHVGERRQRDLAEAESQAAQARAREARLRESLGTQSESAPSSRPDSLFSTGASSIDTPPSSVYGERWRPSPTISVPTSGEGARRDRPSPADDMRRASPARPSPLSSTPTSNTMAHAKSEEQARPTVWIPPDETREPTRKGSTFFDGREPVRKSSGVFDGREPARKPSGFFDAREPVRKPSVQLGSGTQEDRRYQASPSPQPQPQQQQQPPNAPALRAGPLPQQQYQQPQRPTTQSRKTPTPATANAFFQSRRQEASIPPKPAPPPATNARPTPSPTTVRPAPSPTTVRPAPSPTTTRPTQNARPASASVPPYTQPAPTHDPAEDRRRQLREEYTRTEAQRIDDERRRREEEANERRAEEARRRGAEKRRAEEEAREAERREAERKEADRRARAGMPKAGPSKSVDMAEVWAAYESHWAAMATATQLRFRSIPWPVPTPVSEPAGLLPIQIAAFVLSPAHSQGKARKDRLREALLRWHPDRFEAKWLRKVVEEEREIVQEGVGLVVRALNELLSAEGTFAA